MMVKERILVVDDDKAVSGCFFAALNGEGFTVECVFNCIDAMAMVEHCDYDLIILDYLLPDMNGDVFLREAALKRRTKVLLVTGHLTRDMVMAMFKLGICGYLAKPVGRDELIYNVKFHLSATKQSAYAK